MAGVVLALSGSLAHAGSPGARLFYQTPEGCPGQAAFVAAVQARGASFVTGGDRAGAEAEVRLLKVVIRRDASGFAGTLELREGAQTSAPRALRGRSCEEVTDALAVVTAIALQSDPSAEAVADSSADSPASAVVTATAAVPAAPLSPVIPAAEPTPSATREHPTHLVMWKDDVQVEAGKLAFGYQAGYTLTAGAALGLIPNLTLPRVDFALSRTNIVTTPANEDYVISSVMRVRWTFLGVSTYRAPGYSTRLWGLKAGIGGCTPLAYDPLGLIVKACSEIAAGAMSLETRDATGVRTQEKSTGIGTASVELNSQYNLGSLVHLDLQLGGEMWMTKLTAERPDGSRLFRSSMFNAYALVGLGLTF
ncbi:MAG: hypothetical protein ABI895_08245 [Deltaproteobacteria bacterium]